MVCKVLKRKYGILMGQTMSEVVQELDMLKVNDPVVAFTCEITLHEYGHILPRVW
jgi:hypothetical protein